ncbi:hypothetical protein A2W24_06340 [Microgenomates group bacterium RBG_16_45_19]|nr:MAG: hypothetical protein A2W24_06340 [Microgenomates group bacterium RBG_16_45_19]
MKTVQTLGRMIITCLVIGGAFGLLLISIWRAIDLNVEKALVPVDEPGAVWESATPVTYHYLDQELPRSDYLPRHPVYLGKMVYERINLWLTREPEARVTLLMIYANERMGTAMQLLQARRGKEALETTMKSYLYTQAAAAQIKQAQLGPVEREKLRTMMKIHEQALLILEEVMADNLKPKVRGMLEEMIRLRAELIQI